MDQHTIILELTLAQAEMLRQAAGYALYSACEEEGCWEDDIFWMKIKALEAANDMLIKELAPRRPARPKLNIRRL